jgi:hypothetical protein
MNENNPLSEFESELELVVDYIKSNNTSCLDGIVALKTLVYRHIDKHIDKDLKWNWIMNYCHQEKIPPAQNWAYNKAEREFYEHIHHKK